MPQEFLRDVLRTGDASGRARRHWSVLPLSIAAHVLVVTAIVLSPLAVDVELPAIASSLVLGDVMPTVTPPSPPPPKILTPVADPAVGAPIEAPSTIAPERPETIGRPIADGVDGGIGIEPGLPVLSSAAVADVPAPPPPVPAAPVRPGGNIREPKKLVHVPPEYPLIAQQVKVEGTVILEAMLDETGRVDHVRILRSIPLLDAAAIKAVQGWRYTPTTLNGVPVPVLMTITVQFHLNR
jgi:protein TonB